MKENLVFKGGRCIRNYVNKLECCKRVLPVKKNPYYYKRIYFWEIKWIKIMLSVRNENILPKSNGNYKVQLFVVTVFSAEGTI